MPGWQDQTAADAQDGRDITDETEHVGCTGDRRGLDRTCSRSG